MIREVAYSYTFGIIFLVKKIKIDFGPVFEAIVIEINLIKRKWLLIGYYNPHKDMIRSHLNSIRNKLKSFAL